ncbi:helix-turn-helix transcriptional regulator [Vibrio gallicus]|uniref:helix-turn-helix transcriptional regulator n=1 Tax=Vibrio gallicus TaxID=190897 RepID=UPI0021C3DCB4|nr:LuxR C-terminal-related transcriptional regulator [Vibrio gallicus]
MQFNGINSQLFLHKNSGLDKETIQKIQEVTNISLYKLEDYHQKHKPSLTPIIIINFNDKDFDPLDYENPNEPNKKLYMVTTQTPLHLRTTQLLKYGRLKGIFYQGQDIKQTIEGINSLAYGMSWLSRAVIDQLLSYYQSVLLRYAPPHTINLTRREIEVLMALKNGQSNYKLSEQLYLSEHTVKSHLYRIFRKINVKTREEAIVWAHHFLP